MKTTAALAAGRLNKNILPEDEKVSLVVGEKLPSAETELLANVVWSTDEKIGAVNY